MSFKDIKGHATTIEFLKSALSSGRLGHAYLFIGPESIGKAMTARTLAKTANCQKGKTDSCDECPSCMKIDKSIHPDVNWLLPEGKGNVIKIEKIRWLRANISLKPYEGRVKFYIIDKAHHMNAEAANCLLKTLEEPPQDSVLILISQKLEKIFFTVRSRCQIVRFKAMDSEGLAKILKDEYKVSADLSRFLAHYSSGRIGKALTLENEGILKWKNEVIDNFVEEGIRLDEDEFFFGSDKEKILEMLNILAVWYRDILILKSAKTDNLLINTDRIQDLNLEAARFSQEQLMDMLDEIKETNVLIEQNVNPKLALGTLLLARSAICTK